MQNESRTPVYKRIVLKLSGEALQERGGRDNISPQIVREIAERVKEVRDLGIQISIVIGGGNIWRGLAAAHRGMDGPNADYMAILATVLNGLGRQSGVAQMRLHTVVPTAAEVDDCTAKLGNILAYIDSLNEVATDDVEPMVHAVELSNVFRADAVAPSLPREAALANAPKTDGPFFLAPQILDAES